MMKSALRPCLVLRKLFDEPDPTSTFLGGERDGRLICPPWTRKNKQVAVSSDRITLSYTKILSLLCQPSMLCQRSRCLCLPNSKPTSHWAQAGIEWRLLKTTFLYPERNLASSLVFSCTFFFIHPIVHCLLFCSTSKKTATCWFPLHSSNKLTLPTLRESRRKSLSKQVNIRLV